MDLGDLCNAMTKISWTKSRAIGTLNVYYIKQIDFIFVLLYRNESLRAKNKNLRNSTSSRGVVLCSSHTMTSFRLSAVKVM